MFLWIENENRIKRRIRYAHYVLKYIYFGKLKRKFKRVKFEGFSLSFPFGVSANFSVISKSEYSQKSHELIVPVNHALIGSKCQMNIRCTRD